MANDPVEKTDLASTAHGKGASMVGVEDASGRLAANNVEDVLQEILTVALDAATNVGVKATSAQLASEAHGAGASLIGIEDATNKFSGGNVEAALVQLVNTGTNFGTRITDTESDVDVLFSEIGTKTTATDLASNAHGSGASQIGIEDAAGIITATTVEGALHELALGGGGGGGDVTLAILASHAGGEGASLVGIQDVGGLITATQTEGALAEIVVKANTGIANAATAQTTANTAVTNAATAQSAATAAGVAAAAAQATANAAMPTATLASTTLGQGASLVGVHDTAGIITATNAEGAFAEIAANVALRPLTTDLASTAAGKGASTIGIQDAGTLITATNVETALAETFSRLPPVGYFAAHAGLQNIYVAPAAAGGAVINDGKSWRSPKLYINDAIDALSTTGGTIHIMDGSYCGGSVEGQGIWLYGGPATPGFTDISAHTPFIFIGYPGNSTSLQQAWPVARIFPGKPTDVTRPGDRRHVGIWVANNPASPMLFDRLGFGLEWSIGMRFGVDPDPLKDPDLGIDTRGSSMTTATVLVRNCAIEANPADTSRIVAVTGTDNVTASTHTWVFANGNFTSADVGRLIDVATALPANPANSVPTTIVSVTNSTTVVTSSTGTQVDETFTSSGDGLRVLRDTGPGIDMGYCLWLHIEDTIIIRDQDRELLADRRAAILVRTTDGTTQFVVRSCRGANGGIKYYNGPSIWHFEVDSWEVESGGGEPLPPLFWGIDLNLFGYGFLKGVLGADDGPGSSNRIVIEHDGTLTPTQITVQDSGRDMIGPLTNLGSASGTTGGVQESSGTTLPALGQFGFANGQFFADGDFGRFPDPIISNRFYNLIPLHDGLDGISGNVVPQPNGVNAHAVYTSLYGSNVGTTGTWVNAGVTDRRGGNSAFRLESDNGATDASVGVGAPRPPNMAVGDAMVFSFWCRFPNLIGLNTQVFTLGSSQTGGNVGTFERRGLNGNGQLNLKRSSGTEWHHYSGYIKVLDLGGGSSEISFFTNFWGSQDNPIEVDEPVLIWVKASDNFDQNEIGSIEQNMAPYLQIPAGAGATTQLHQKMLAQGGLGVGNSVAATTPGTVVKKMEIFDGSGVSLGFIPIYDAIT